MYVNCDLLLFGTKILELPDDLIFGGKLCFNDKVSKKSIIWNTRRKIMKKVFIPSSVSKLVKSEITANNKKVPNNQALQKIKNDISSLIKNVTKELVRESKSFLNTFSNELEELFNELNNEKIKYSVYAPNTPNCFTTFQVYQNISFTSTFEIVIDKKDSEVFESIVRFNDVLVILTHDEIENNKIRYIMDANLSVVEEEEYN